MVQYPPPRKRDPEPDGQPTGPGRSREKERKPLTPHRFRRRLLRVLALLVLIGFVGLLAVTRTPLAKVLVLPHIARAAGVEIQAGSLFVASDLDVVLTDAVIRVPAVDGPGGELMRVDRLEATLDWYRAILGITDGLVQRVALDGPVLRLSQATDTGQLNAAAIRVSGSGSAAPVSSLPTVAIRGGLIELGEHTSDRFSLLTQLALTGDLLPSSERAEGGHVFRVEPQVGSGVTTELLGRIDADGLTVFVNGLVLDEWPATKVPSRVRPAFQRLDLDGRIQPLRVRVDQTGTVEVDVRMRGVALNLPFDGEVASDAGQGSESAPLRMVGVTGEMTIGTSGIFADVRGRVDNLPYQVRFDVWGTGAESPFIAQLLAGPADIRRDAKLFRFTPPVVAQKLDMFVDPQARATSTVWLRRGTPPPGAGPVKTARQPVPAALETPNGPSDTRVLLAGELVLDGGVAAYRGFPYPFRNLTGRFLFDEETLTIDNIRGTNGAGATIAVNGWVGPLGPAAEVQIEVDVRGVPIDEELTAIMDQNRREIIESLFSREQYDRLVKDGLLAPSPETATPEAPAFDLGGLADVKVTLHRLYGDVSVWRQRQDITIRDAGMLSTYFPVPLVGDDIQLVVESGVALLEESAFTTLRGGNVTLYTRADVSSKNAPPPIVRITAGDVPIDDLLIYALPGPGALAEEDGPANLSSVLDRLRLEGTLDCVADIGPHDRYGVGWDIVVDFDGVDARPDPRGRLARLESEAQPATELVLTDLTGTIRAQRDRIDLRLNAVATADPPLTPTYAPLEAGAQPPTHVDLTASVDLPVRRGLPTDPDENTPEGQPVVRTTAAASSLDLDLPIERLISLFAPEFADRMNELRDAYHPTGRMDLAAELTGRLGPDVASSARIALTADAIEHAEADTFGGRVAIRDATGRVVLDTGGEPVVSFDAMQGELLFNGDPAGTIGLTGILPLGKVEAWPLIGAASFPQLHANLTDGRFDSALTNAVVTQRLGEGLADIYDRISPTGDYDLVLDFTPLPPTPEDVADAAERGALGKTTALIRSDISGVLRPRSFAFDTSGGRLAVDGMDGRVRFTQRGGSFDDLVGSGDGWSFLSSADWRTPESGAFRLDAGVEASVDAHDDGLPATLVEGLPTVAQDLIQTLQIDATGGAELKNGRLIVERPDPAEHPESGIEVLAQGDVRVEDGSIELGAPVSRLDGDVRFEAWSRGSGEDRELGWSVGLSADRLRVSGLRLGRTNAQIISGREPGEILIPDIAADMHGGRAAGAVRIEPPATVPVEGVPTFQRSFRADARLADVHLAPLLEDLALGVRPDMTDLVALEEAQAFEGPTKPDGSRGRVDADMTVSGPLGLRDGLRGRGRLRASGGSVLALPVLTPLIEFSNLQLPIGEQLDLAEAAFYLEDETITFESLSVFSASVELVGFGTMNWPTTELDLRFRSEAVRPIPIISDVLEAVRDELITTKLTGPAGAPTVSTEQFPATRRFLGALLGIPESEQAARLRRIERTARDERLRALNALERATRATAEASAAGS